MVKSMIVLKIAQAVVSRTNVIVLECDCTGMWLYRNVIVQCVLQYIQ